MEFNLVVIGAGPAGYSAAIRAAQLGAKTALIEQSHPGGTCLNCGCIPTKTLWHAMGKPYAEAVVKKARTIDAQRKGLTALIKSYPVELIAGTAAFESSTSLRVTAPDQTTRSIRFSKCIIATGSHPRPLPGVPFDHEHVIDSSDALNLTAVPKTMMILGGGVIGVEMATIFASFGTQVHLCERESGILPGEDPHIIAEVSRSLARLGVKADVCYLADQKEFHSYEKVLVAIGRAAQCDTLGLDKADVVCDHRGITVNEFLETSTTGIYAAGDVTGRWQLAYTAQSDGCIAAENALRGTRRSAVYTGVPRVIFSKPVCAAAGINECQADPATMRVGTFPLTANAMAFIEGERAGWVKIIADAQSGTILGGALAGKNAEELIFALSVAVRHSLTGADLGRELFFHPSLSESIHQAVEQGNGSCVDLPPSKPAS